MFDTFNHKFKEHLLSGKNKKVLGMIEDHLGDLIIKEFEGLNSKIYFQLTEDDKLKKGKKMTQKCVIRVETKAHYYKICLMASQLKMR